MAGDVRLYEHGDFTTLLALASRQLGIPEPWLEKDYYLTEALRLITAKLPEHTFLKGGTSLSKGWSMLSRMSEDIDLVLNRPAFEKKLRGADVDVVLLDLATTISAHPGLDWEAEKTGTTGGKARTDVFRYHSALTATTLGIAQTVIVEAGVRSGYWPIEKMSVESLAARVARDLGRADIAEDLAPFEMNMLHFRRTFVEKLMAIHSLVVKYQHDGSPLGRNARHYADLYVLGQKPEAVALLGGEEFEQIRVEQDQIGRSSFPRNYVEAPRTYRDSPALFPDDKLRAELERQYVADVTPLFFGEVPGFKEILGLFESVRERL